MAYRLMLKELRERAGLTQAQLAEMSGIKLGTLRSWEQSTSPATPRLDDACAICDVLRCTPNDLCGWYLAHPEDRPRPVANAPGYADAQQRELNELYERSGPQARGAMVVSARGMASLEKEGAGVVPHDGVSGGAA
ncbi:helix-turn-helix domain-containing protein [uncultured Parolsenella sp.]|uniref:helix-turn-helix transcriptional regulator n=1 Tax=uncultured Parolsenella sp. TaxID=2083008 RepID=UPI0027D93191|nr:helix-turn-helix domain-containing protein [uncultured Parolsenella sp.]